MNLSIIIKGKAIYKCQQTRLRRQPGELARTTSRNAPPDENHALVNQPIISPVIKIGSSDSWSESILLSSVIRKHAGNFDIRNYILTCFSSKVCRYF